MQPPRSIFAVTSLLFALSGLLPIRTLICDLLGMYVVFLLCCLSLWKLRCIPDEKMQLISHSTVLLAVAKVHACIVPRSHTRYNTYC
ncbi:hypothetical protein GGR52DRAFT_522423 [Hypoxylon sp. FL1284]|nr:hypothetical protein GGR52DRAFT_522423 [Hypoxylon sp. FL1284]